jgi:hypothetical protein
LTSEEAFAKPVYLSCSTQVNGESERFDLAADEDTNMVTISDKSGDSGSQSMRATFSSDQVSFGNGLFDYRLNRIDLTITVRRWNGNIEKGKCQIKPAPRRAF